MPAKGFFCAVVLGVGFASAPAAAQSIMGVWQSPPDSKGQIGQVQVRHCAAAFCGQLVRTYDRDGLPITLPTTGLELFGEMTQTRPGTYGNGWVYVPFLGRKFPAEIEIRGDALILEGCIGPMCKKQVWQRVAAD